MATLFSKNNKIMIISFLFFKMYDINMCNDTMPIA